MKPTDSNRPVNGPSEIPKATDTGGAATDSPMALPAAGEEPRDLASSGLNDTAQAYVGLIQDGDLEDVIQERDSALKDTDALAKEIFDEFKEIREADDLTGAQGDIVARLDILKNRTHDLNALNDALEFCGVDSLASNSTKRFQTRMTADIGDEDLHQRAERLEQTQQVLVAEASELQSELQRLNASAKDFLYSQDEAVISDLHSQVQNFINDYQFQATKQIWRS